MVARVLGVVAVQLLRCLGTAMRLQGYSVWLLGYCYVVAKRLLCSC